MMSEGLFKSSLGQIRCVTVHVSHLWKDLLPCIISLPETNVSFICEVNGFLKQDEAASKEMSPGSMSPLSEGAGGLTRRFKLSKFVAQRQK